jgi:hypothetical protein
VLEIEQPLSVAELGIEDTVELVHETDLETQSVVAEDMGQFTPLMPILRLAHQTEPLTESDGTVSDNLPLIAHGAEVGVILVST